MKEDAASESTLRQFLLGNVDQEERERLESLFITDSVARDKILAAEQDLIDDYLDDSLTAAEKQSFIQQYADTPLKKRKLRIATSIKDWATAQGKVSPPPEPVHASFWSRIGDIVWPKRALAIPIAAMAMVGVIALAIWLNSRMERRETQLAMQEEIVKLNVPSNLSQTPPKASLTLRPGLQRSGDTQNDLVITPDSGIAELRLLWIQPERYPRYSAVVSRANRHKLVTVPNLQPEADGNSIRLRLPDHVLTNGDYQVVLTGITANGAAGLNEEYFFRVQN